MKPLRPMPAHFWAIIKKQGTSGLLEVHDNIDGTQSCMCCKATHVADCGSGRMSQFFRFFCISWT